MCSEDLEQEIIILLLFLHILRLWDKILDEDDAQVEDNKLAVIVDLEQVDDDHHGLSSYEQVEDRKRVVKVKLSAASWRLETRTLSSHLLDLEWPGFGQRFDVIQNVTRHFKVQWPLQEQTLLADLQPDLGPSKFRSNLDNFEQKHKKFV